MIESKNSKQDIEKNPKLVRIAKVIKSDDEIKKFELLKINKTEIKFLQQVLLNNCHFYKENNQT